MITVRNFLQVDQNQFVPLAEVPQLPGVDVVDQGGYLDGYVAVEVDRKTFLGPDDRIELDLFWKYFLDDVLVMLGSGSSTFRSGSFQISLRRLPQHTVSFECRNSYGIVHRGDVSIQVFLQRFLGAAHEFLEWLTQFNSTTSLIQTLRNALDHLEGVELTNPYGPALDVGDDSQTFTEIEIWTMSGSSLDFTPIEKVIPPLRYAPTGAVVISLSGNVFFGYQQWDQLETLWSRLTDLLENSVASGVDSSYFENSSTLFEMRLLDGETIELTWTSDVYLNSSRARVDLALFRREFSRAGREFCQWIGQPSPQLMTLCSRLERWA